MPSNSPILEKIGRTSEQVDELLVYDDYYLLEYDKELKIISLDKIDTGSPNFNGESVDILESLAKGFLETVEGTEKCEVCYIGDNPYIRALKSDTNYGCLKYFTVINNQMISIALSSSHQITEEDEHLMDVIVKSIVLPESNSELVKE